MHINQQILEEIKLKLDSYRQEQLTDEELYLMIVKEFLKLVSGSSCRAKTLFDKSGLKDEPLAIGTVEFCEETFANASKVLITDSRMIGDAANLRLMARRLKASKPELKVYCLLTNSNAGKLLSTYSEFYKVFAFDVNLILNFDSSQGLETVLAYLRGFLDEIRSENIDIAYNVKRNFITLATLLMLNPKKQYGWQLNRNKTVAFKGNVWHYHLFSSPSQINFAEHIQYLTNDLLDPIVHTALEERKLMSLAEYGIEEEKKYYAVVPGARFKEKMWPKENFLKLMEMIRDNCNHVPILVGGNDARDVCSWLAENYDGETVDIAGRLPIEKLPHALNASSFVISNDTGPKHIAVHESLPVVELFCLGGNFWNYGPYGNNSYILSAEQPVIAKRKENFEGSSMNRIRPDAVFGVVEKLLSGEELEVSDESLSAHETWVFRSLYNEISGALVYQPLYGTFDKGKEVEKIIHYSFKNLLYIINSYMLKREPAKTWLPFDVLLCSLWDHGSNKGIILEEIDKVSLNISEHLSSLNKIRATLNQKDLSSLKNEIDKSIVGWFRSFADFLWSLTLSCGKDNLAQRNLKYYELNVLAANFLIIFFSRLNDYLLKSE